MFLATIATDPRAAGGANGQRGRAARDPAQPQAQSELATLLHFGSIVEHTGPFLEFPARPVSYEDWYEPHFTIRDGGFIDVPTGPGLGVAYDPAIWEEAERI